MFERAYRFVAVVEQSDQIGSEVDALLNELDSLLNNTDTLPDSP